MREQEIRYGVKWLTDYRVKDLDVLDKTKYLREKGLTTEEIVTAVTLAVEQLAAAESPNASMTGGLRGAGQAPDTAEEKNGNGQAEMLQALMKIKAGGTLGGNPSGPAHSWHSRRRVQLMERPAVRALLAECGVGQPKELIISASVVAAVVVLHVLCSRALNSLAASAPASVTAFAVLLTSATVGAQFAYLLQALNHELGHGGSVVGLNKVGRRVVFLACFALGQMGSALCHVPWTVYYMGGGHSRHHLYAGSARDVDEDALFVLYQPRFPGVFRRLAWLSVAAFSVPILMFFSLIRCAMYDWRSNIKELTLCTIDFSLTIFTFYSIGGVGAIYLTLSTLFSMGFLCHPLVGFWILQHLCVGGDQPTASYYGSTILNVLSLNELLHVEHHDLSGIAWRHLPRLRELVPELYDGLWAEYSLMELISAWARAESPARDKKFNWDFGCRTHWGYTRRNAAITAHFMKAMEAQAAQLAGTNGTHGRAFGGPTLSSSALRNRGPGSTTRTNGGTGQPHISNDKQVVTPPDPTTPNGTPPASPRGIKETIME